MGVQAGARGPYGYSPCPRCSPQSPAGPEFSRKPTKAPFHADTCTGSHQGTSTLNADTHRKTTFQVHIWH